MAENNLYYDPLKTKQVDELVLSENFNIFFEMIPTPAIYYCQNCQKNKSRYKSISFNKKFLDLAHTKMGLTQDNLEAFAMKLLTESQVIGVEENDLFYEKQVTKGGSTTTTIITFSSFNLIKELKERIEMMKHDPLTGLLRRQYFSEKVADICNSDTYKNNNWTAVFVDLYPFH